MCGQLMMGAPLASDEGSESGRLSVRVQSNSTMTESLLRRLQELVGVVC